MTVPTNDAQAATQEEKKVTPAESFQQMRKMLEQERADKEKLRQEKERLEKEIQKSRQGAAHDDEDDEPYIDPKTFKRKMASFEEVIEQKIERKAEEKARSLMEEEKRNAYLKQNSDFEQVMSQEVLQKFGEKHPAMVEAILKMPDNFDRQRLVYETIKSTGLLRKEESTVQKKIDENRRSPYYQPSGVGAAPYGNSGDFSDVGQKSAYEKMKELQRRLRL